MQVEVSTDDETGVSEYSVSGKSLRVRVEPSATAPEYVFVEVWDEAGCSARETRPADQAERIALKTLFNEIRADERESATV